MTVFTRAARHLPRTFACLTGLVLIASAVACGGPGVNVPAAGQQGADKYLFDRGNTALGKNRWIEGREYLKRLVDTYPQSPYRQDAKLGVGDSYLGEGRIDTDILAANEFREFLSFFPLATRADYAQYKLAVSQAHQVLSPERDQGATRDAIKELGVFLRNYPTSQYTPDVQKLLRTMHDRLSMSEYLVGEQYFRLRYYPGAVSRLLPVITNDPEFSRMDAVYYYLAESYYRMKRHEEALPYFDKLAEGFPKSELLKKAKTRVAELKH